MNATSIIQVQFGSVDQHCTLESSLHSCAGVFFSFSTENTKGNAYTGNEHILDLSLELLNSFRSCQRYVQDNARINTPRQRFSNSFYHTK